MTSQGPTRWEGNTASETRAQAWRCVRGTVFMALLPKEAQAALPQGQPGQRLWGISPLCPFCTGNTCVTPQFSQREV